MVDLLETLGIKPVKTTNGGNQVWYLSPLRPEKEPSFTVSVSDNCWKDFGGNGGNILDFIMEYQNTDLRGALAYLDNITIYSASTTIRKMRIQNNDNTIIIQKVKPLSYEPLIQQLQDKGIRPDIAKLYLQEVYYLNGGKKFFGYGMKNDNEGYEIHNKLFKGGTLKSPTTLKGIDSTKITLFEGMTDFLSALQYYNILAFQSDVIVMHSLAFKTNIAAELKDQANYKNVYLYLDNDNSGKEAVSYFQEELSATTNIRDMSQFYADYKDVNEFWCAENKQ